MASNPTLRTATIMSAVDAANPAAPRDPARTPLLGPPTATAAQAQALAVAAGAARPLEVEAFVHELWRLGAAAGYDPAPVFAQFCLETGTGTSPAWRERLNPGGIGITDGGDQGLAFADGAAAAQAMLVHLSAYVRGYDPALWRYLHLDPRYLAVLRAGYGGSVQTLGDLGNGRWATDPLYAAKIARRLEALRAQPVLRPLPPPAPGDDTASAPGRTDGGEAAAPIAPGPAPAAAPVPEGIIWIGTLNWHERTGGQPPEAIVYHVTDDLEFEHVRSHFTNLASQASAHFVVGRMGELWQFVPTRHAAWTNGDYASWRRDIPWLQDAIARCQRGERNLNDYTVNIEFMGKPGLPFTPAQFDRAVEITRYLLDRYPRIQPHRGRMLRHADINADTRPYCPGPTFPLREIILAVGGDPVRREDAAA